MPVIRLDSCYTIKIIIDKYTKTGNNDVKIYEYKQ